MNFLNLTTLFSVANISLLGQVLASPFTPETDIAPTTIRTVRPTKSNSIQPAAHTDNHGDTCDSDVNTGLAGHYIVTLVDWGNDPRGCGRGVLDNLRGQCGDVDEWVCDTRENNGAFMTFYLSGPRKAHCLKDAVWLASPPDKREEGFCCTWNEGMGGGQCT